MAVGGDAIRAARAGATYVRAANHEELALESFPFDVEFDVRAGGCARFAFFHAFCVRVIVCNIRVQCDLTFVAFVYEELSEA